MFLRLLFLLVVIAACAVAQVAVIPTANVPPGSPNAEIVCPKARQVLESSHQKQIVVQMIVNADGSVNWFKILSPNALKPRESPHQRGIQLLVRAASGKRGAAACHTLASSVVV